MAWISLIIAGGCEVTGVWGMKAFSEKKRAFYMLVVIASFGLSLALLTFAFQTIPTSTAYAVWTGLGATGSTVMGILIYNDPKSWKRILCIFLIISGVVGLKLFS